MLKSKNFNLTIIGPPPIEQPPKKFVLDLHLEGERAAYVAAFVALMSNTDSETLEFKKKFCEALSISPVQLRANMTHPEDMERYRIFLIAKMRDKGFAVEEY